MELAAVGIPALLAQESTQTETTQTEEETHNPILPEPDELIFGSLAFLLVFVVLARYALPTIRQGLEARRMKIQEDLEKAEQAKAEAERTQARYEQQLRDARAEANRIIEESRKTADSMRRDLLAKAEDESRQVVARAQEEIRAERDRVFEELRSSVAELSVTVAERVVGESLTKERHLKLVDGYIDELTKKGGRRRGSS
jgi:F-type H+-transporting ATPase subunit b